MIVSQHFFGQHEGHLRDEANDLAEEEPQEITTDAELPDGIWLGHKQQKF